jgi:hypothetical protein
VRVCVRDLRVISHTQKMADPQQSFLSELSSMETPAGLANALAELWESPQLTIVLWFLSKESMVLIRGACQHQDDEIRRLAIVGYGKLLLRVWAVFYQDGSLGFEGIVKGGGGSLSELRRAADDFVDFGVDLIRQYTTSLTGAPIVSSDITQPPILLTVGCFSAYCEVLNDLLSVVVSETSNFRKWCDALQGNSTINTSNAVHITHWQPLVSTCVSLLMKDIEEIRSWSARWRGCDLFYRLVSSALLVILRDIPLSHPLSTVVFDALHSSTANMFGMSSGTDETTGSRTGSLPLPIARFAEEWVLHSLSYFWETEAVCAQEECIGSIWEAMEITQYAMLAHARIEVMDI